MSDDKRTPRTIQTYRKYKGILAKPIVIDPSVPRIDATELFETRLQALCDWYGVAPGEWEDLAFHLALTHVPGFGVKYISSRRGRPGRPADEVAGALKAFDLWKPLVQSEGFPATDAALSRLFLDMIDEHLGRAKRPIRQLEKDARKLAKDISKARKSRRARK